MKYISLSLVTFSMFLFAPVLMAQRLDTVRVRGYILKETHLEKSVKKRNEGLKSVDYPIDVNYTYRFLVCKDEQCQFDMALKCFEKEPLDSIFTFCPILRPHFFFKSVLDTETPTEFQCPIPKLENTCEFKIKDKVAQVFFVDGLWVKVKYNSNLNIIKPPFDLRYTNFKGTVDLFYLVEVIKFDECVRNEKVRGK